MSREQFPEVPEPFKVITGYQGQIEEKIDSFFGGIITFLNLDDESVKRYIFRDVQVLGLERPDPFHPFDPSDDQVTWLRARGLTVAAAIERRDDLNYVEVLFSRWLTESRVRFIRTGRSEI